MEKLLITPENTAMFYGTGKVKEYFTKNLRVFETTRALGIMTGNLRVYPEGTTREEVREEFLDRRLKLGSLLGVDGRKIVMQTQDGKGTCEKITEEKMASQEDGWNIDFNVDMLMIDQMGPAVVAGYAVADCPVLILADPKKHVAVQGHCGTSYINQGLPIQMVNALREETDCKSEDIFAYLSSCASKRNYVYDASPAFAKDPAKWKNSLSHYQGLWHIDVRRAIIDQLVSCNLNRANFMLNLHDTTVDPAYYSDTACSSRNPILEPDPTKLGRYFVGITYQKKRR